MSSEKKLKRAAVRFRREDPAKQYICTMLINGMAKLIKKIGAPEVTAGFKNGKYYELSHI